MRVPHQSKLSSLPEQHTRLCKQWGYVGWKKRGKPWLSYACSPEYDEVPASCCGGRSAAAARRLYRQLGKAGTEEFCTDHWPSFTRVLPEKGTKQAKH